MKAVLSALPFLGLLAGCEEPTTRTADYRPEEAGTVDHALCLLGFRAVPLRELITGHHLVEAQVNGRTGVFVLDTGANASVVDMAHAAGFGVGEGRGLPAAAIGLGGGLRARQARIDSLVIGGIPIRRDRLMIADLSQVAGLLAPIAGRPLHGIIGQDVMKEHRAVIDVARPILYLVEADEDPAPVPSARCRAADQSRKSPAAIR